MNVKLRIPPVHNAGPILYIGRWLKRIGDPVNINEPLVQLATNNIPHDVLCPATGILSKIIVVNGTSVDIGDVVGEIATF